MQNQIFPQQFTALTREVREHLIIVFGLPMTPSAPTHVMNGDLVDSGYTKEDLQLITLEKMCEYIGSQETFGRAWELTCAKAYSELHPPVGMIGGDEFKIKVEKPVETQKVEVKLPDESIQKIEISEEQIIDDPKAGHEIKPWCDTCVSRGVRHLKECPKYVPIEAH